MGASLCALMFAAVGCSSDDDSSDNGKVTINATAEIKNIGDADASQRVVLGGANGVSPLWETDDQIAVKVDGGTANTLTLSSGATTQHGVFNGDIPAGGTTMTAYYPASAATATDLTTQTGTVEAAAKVSVMFATANYSASPKFNFANKTSILSFSMAVPTGFNASGTLTATVFGANSKGTLGTDGSWTGTVAAPIKVSGITVSDNKINGYVVVIPGSNVNVLSILVSDGTSSYQTAAYTSATATILANQIISITKGLAEIEYVDLGLPSGLLWATTNIGATNPEDYGDCFAWGETATKTDYGWTTYKWGTSRNNITKYNATDGDTVLVAADDAATANWGSKWRMPTKAEFQELLDSTTDEWTTVNGVKGRKFTSKVTGHTDKSIFFPAAGWYDGSNYSFYGAQGHYWSSSLRSGILQNAYYMFFNPDKANSGSTLRAYGMPVRPVRDN